MSGGGRVDRTLPLVLIAVAALLPGPVAAQTAEREVSERDRFHLDTGCAVRLVVEGLPDTAGEIGLTKSRITTAVRSRLRAARIYDPEALAYLYINVNVLGGTGRTSPYSYSIELYKWLYDLSAGRGPAGTWHSGSLGQGDASFILASVAQHMDAFIDEYLRVNECGQ